MWRRVGSYVNARLGLALRKTMRSVILKIAEQFGTFL